jgi:hypothetical protein
MLISAKPQGAVTRDTLCALREKNERLCHSARARDRRSRDRQRVRVRERGREREGGSEGGRERECVRE